MRLLNIVDRNQLNRRRSAKWMYCSLTNYIFNRSNKWESEKRMTCLWKHYVPHWAYSAEDNFPSSFHSQLPKSLPNFRGKNYANSHQDQRSSEKLSLSNKSCSAWWRNRSFSAVGCRTWPRYKNVYILPVSLNRDTVRRAHVRKPKVRRTNPLPREEYC